MTGISRFLLCVAVVNDGRQQSSWNKVFISINAYENDLLCKVELILCIASCKQIVCYNKGHGFDVCRVFFECSKQNFCFLYVLFRL